MMESIQNWAMTVCVTMAGAAVFHMLLPGSGLKKMAMFAVNLFFISSLISPLILNPPKFDFDVITSEVTQNEDLDSLVDGQVEALTQKNLDKQVGQLLSQHNYTAEKIETTIHIEADNSISITKLKIWIRREQQSSQSAIEQLVSKEVGVQPEIAYTDEE